MLNSRLFALCGGVLLLTAGTALAQQPTLPAPTPTTPAAPPAPRAGGPAPAAAAAPVLVFTSDAAVVIFTVKAEGAGDFEAFFVKLKEGFAQGAKPEYRAMAEGWTLFRVADLTQANQVLYASVIDPAVKSADYDPVKLLTETLPAEAAALYPKLKDALVGVNRMNLTTVMKMGQ